MKMTMKTLSAAVVLALLSSLAVAKLPAPSDEAKAKAAEAAAKTAWAGKADAFQLCKAQDKVVAHYKKAPAVKDAKPAAKGAPGAVSASAPTPATATACADPGPFVYTPAVATPAAAAPSPAPAASAAPPATKS